MDADDEQFVEARAVDEEEENEEDDDEHHEEAGPARNEDGSYNGGVAVPPNEEDETKSPSECDLVRLLWYSFYVILRAQSYVFPAPLF